MTITVMTVFENDFCLFLALCEEYSDTFYWAGYGSALISLWIEVFDADFVLNDVVKFYLYIYIYNIYYIYKYINNF